VTAAIISLSPLNGAAAAALDLGADMTSLDQRMVSAIANSAASAQRQRAEIVAFGNDPSTDPFEVLKIQNSMADYAVRIGYISAVTKKMTSVVDQLVMK